MARHRYSFEEYADMHLAYGAAGQCAPAARNIYHARFPLRVLPCVNTFLAVDRRLRESGSFAVPNVDAGRERYIRNVQFEENVLEMVAATTSTSSSAIGTALGVNHVITTFLKNACNLHMAKCILLFVVTGFARCSIGRLTRRKPISVSPTEGARFG